MCSGIAYLIVQLSILYQDKKGQSIVTIWKKGQPGKLKVSSWGQAKNTTTYSDNLKRGQVS